MGIILEVFFSLLKVCNKTRLTVACSSSFLFATQTILYSRDLLQFTDFLGKWRRHRKQKLVHEYSDVHLLKWVLHLGSAANCGVTYTALPAQWPLE